MNLKRTLGKKLSHAFGFQVTSCEGLLHALESLNLGESVFEIDDSFYSGGSPGILYTIVQIHKYTLDVDKIALSCLMFLLGLLPFGCIIAPIEAIKDISSAIKTPTEKESVVYVLLKQLAKDGVRSFGTNDLVKSFLSNSACDRSAFKNKADVFDVLDSLSDKGLLMVRTRSVEVLR